MAAEDFGPRTAADVNLAPGQVQSGARKRRAKELAGFLQRRGISATNMQTMHPALLEHHWRAAGLKSGALGGDDEGACQAHEARGTLMATTNRDQPFSNGNLPFQLMNMVPNPKRPQDRWSDAPGFQGGKFVAHPMGGEQFQMYLDPEKHIERTSGYEGSTDRRDPQTGETQSTHDTWIDKKQEAAMAPGTLDRHGLPVHGAGILEGLRQGESIRDPARSDHRAVTLPQSREPAGAA